MKKQRLLFLAILLTSADVANAQSFYKKWGKFSDRELELTTTSLDSTANAIILGEYGTIKVDYGNIYIYMYVRKKILNSNGFDEADITLPYYAKDNIELISNLKARTINKLDNGKTQIIALEKKDLFTLDIDEKWKAKRFTFPAIKEGSIIEYRYTKRSQRYYYLDEWRFQKELPVLHSELEVVFPDVMEYMSFLSGHRLADKYQGKVTNKFELQNLPPIKDQKYVYNIDNYTEKIRFQLKSYMQSKVGSSATKVEVIQSWDKLAQEIITDSEHNSFARDQRHFEQLVEALGFKALPHIERIEKIHDYVIHNFRWNEKNGIYNSQKLKSFLESKTGNTADINLYLINMLKAAGVDANPMVIATRSYGKIIKSYPLLSQFNRLIAYVKLNERSFFMNAINEYRPYKFPALEDYVDEGFVLKKDSSEWVNININHNSSTLYLVNVNFDRQGQAIFHVSSQHKGYNAMAWRSGIGSSGIQYIYKALSNKNIDKIDDPEVKNLHHISAPLEVTFDYRNIESSVIQDKFIYFDPYLFDEFLSNPFNEERKDYPIELPYESGFNMVMSVEIPEGFEVAGMPVNEQVALPGKAVTFLYGSSAAGNKIQLKIKVDFAKRTLPRNYNDYMKEFYDLLNEKLNEQIVLKKQAG
jgi:hypothetical protein